MVGADQNSSRDTGLFVDGLDMLREKTDAAVLLIHHTGKDAGRGARGSNAFFGEVDLEAKVERDIRGVTLTTTATKSYEEPPPMRFAPVIIVGGSLQLPNICFDYMGAPGEESTVTERAVLDLLAEADTPLSPKQIETMTGINNRTLRRTLARLTDAGQITRTGTAARPNYLAAQSNRTTGH